jgi:hypothetical protein
MKTQNSCENPTTGDGALAAPLRAVIAYDEVSAGRRAMGMLNRLLEQEKQSVHLLPELWRFDLLHDPDWHEQAISDALRADLLILSTSHLGTIPSAIERWISAILARRQGASIAILSLFGCQNDWSFAVQVPAIPEFAVPRKGRRKDR